MASGTEEEHLTEEQVDDALLAVLYGVVQGGLGQAVPPVEVGPVLDEGRHHALLAPLGGLGWGQGAGPDLGGEVQGPLTVLLPPAPRAVQVAASPHQEHGRLGRNQGAEYG